MKKENLERRQAEMRARLDQKRLAPALRARELRECNTRSPQVHRPLAGPELAAWLKFQALRQREGIAFREMGRKLDRYERELRRERYVTAMLGVRTSWARVEEYGKYYVFGSLKSDNGRRPERPERGGNWAFNPRDGRKRA